jgi:hypothetical protein
MNRLKQLEELWSLYRTAFGEWASQVGRLDVIRRTAPESGVLEGERCRVAAAETRYREIRNRLVDEMVACRVAG